MSGGKGVKGKKGSPFQEEGTKLSIERVKNILWKEKGQRGN